MEIGIDSFAAFVTDAQGNPVGTAQDALRELLDRIQLADEKRAGCICHRGAP